MRACGTLLAVLLATCTSPVIDWGRVGDLRKLITNKSWLMVQAIMLIGVVFKSAQPDESEEERRELERLVAEAAKPKKKAKKEKAPAAASSGTPPGTTPTVEVPPPKA